MVILDMRVILFINKNLSSINDNINNIIKDVSVVFIFYYEYENEEVRLTYKIEAEDTLELIEIESEETKWIWE